MRLNISITAGLVGFLLNPSHWKKEKKYVQVKLHKIVKQQKVKKLSGKALLYLRSHYMITGST